MRKNKNKSAVCGKAFKQVPFSSLSSDPAIDKLRRQLESGEDLIINPEDGSIHSCEEDEELLPKVKAKIPNTVLSTEEELDDIINTLRGEEQTDGASKEPEKAEPAAKPAAKAQVIPNTILS